MLSKSRTPTGFGFYSSLRTPNNAFVTPHGIWYDYEYEWTSVACGFPLSGDLMERWNVMRKRDEEMEVTLRAAYIALQIDPFIALIFVLLYTVYGYVRTKL